MGHPEEEYCMLAKSRKGLFKDSSSKTVKASLDTAPFISSRRYYQEAVRTSKCEILVSSGRCAHCKAYRPTLRALSRKRRVSHHQIGGQPLVSLLGTGDFSPLLRGNNESRAVQQRYVVAILVLCLIHGQ